VVGRDQRGSRAKCPGAQEEGPLPVGGNSFLKPTSGRMVAQNAAFSVVGERNSGWYRVGGAVESSKGLDGDRGPEENLLGWETPVATLPASKGARREPICPVAHGACPDRCFAA
jgi:hypothetical protein